MLSFREALTKGVRSDARQGIGSANFSVYSGAKPTPHGARGSGTLSTFISSPTLSGAGITINYPYPQVFRGKKYTILATQTGLWYFSESTGALTAITTYDLRSPHTTKSITSGGTWRFVDFHDTWMLFNGACTVVKSNWLDPNKVFVQNETTVVTGCDFKGRLVLGGFDNSNFWSTAWTTVWNSWTEQAREWGMTLSAPGTNWVYWSPIGQATFIELMLASTAVNDIYGVWGGFDLEDPRFLEGLRSLESGMMPMDYQGTVWNCVPFRDSVIVYGSEGISAIKPFVEPAPTFGLIESVGSVGLASRNSVCVNKDLQLFVGSDGVLYSIDGKFQLTRLGFEEYLNPLLGTEILITKDPNRNEYFISSDDITYHLTESGMGRYYTNLISAFYYDGPIGTDTEFRGIRDSTADLSTATLTTEIFDFGTGDLKTIERIQWITKNYTVAFTVSYRNSRNESFVTTSSYSVDNRGWTYVGLSGIEFYLTISLTGSPLTAETNHLNDIIVFLREGTKMSVKPRMNA